MLKSNSNSKTQNIKEPLLEDTKSKSKSFEDQLEKKVDAIFSKDSQPSSWDLTKTFLGLAGPAIITAFVGYITTFTLITLSGHFNDESKLAAMGITLVVCQLSVFSILISLTIALESLTSQAFGSGNLELCGVYLNRGRVVLLTFFIPIAIGPFFFGEKIFLAIG